MLALLLVCTLIAPAFAFAEEASTTPRGPKAQGTALADRFCTNIDTISTRIMGGIGTREGKLKERRDVRLDRVGTFPGLFL